MDKQKLNLVSELIAYDEIPSAKKGETLEAYVSRAYPVFDSSVEKSSNPVVKQVQEDCKDELMNAIAKLPVRRLLVSRFCQANDPFTLEPPKEATTADILEFNGVKGSEADLKKIMGDEAFEAYINKLKTPKKDGMSQTEINREREKHYAKYEPLMPSEKSYSHNGGGTTRDYHWQGSIQGLYVEDHNNFLAKFNVSDQFVVIPEPEEEGEAEAEAETAKEETKAKK